MGFEGVKRAGSGMTSTLFGSFTTKFDMRSSVFLILDAM